MWMATCTLDLVQNCQLPVPVLLEPHRRATISGGLHNFSHHEHVLRENMLDGDAPVRRILYCRPNFTVNCLAKATNEVVARKEIGAIDNEGGRSQ